MINKSLSSVSLPFSTKYDTKNKRKIIIMKKKDSYIFDIMKKNGYNSIEFKTIPSKKAENKCYSPLTLVSNKKPIKKVKKLSLLSASQISNLNNQTKRVDNIKPSKTKTKIKIQYPLTIQHFSETDLFPNRRVDFTNKALIKKLRQDKFTRHKIHPLDIKLPPVSLLPMTEKVCQTTFHIKKEKA